MNARFPLTGALLVGGQSRRMGTPKALLARGETTLGAYLFTLLERRFARPPLVVGDGVLDVTGRSFQRVPDRAVGAGPLSALLGLCDAMPGSDFLVLPVDLYALDEAALDWLADQRSERFLATRPLLPDRPHGEPLPAIYRAASAPVLEASWQRGERSLVASLPPDQIYEPRVPDSHVAALVGVNRPEDLAALRRPENDSKL